MIKKWPDIRPSLPEGSVELATLGRAVLANTDSITGPGENGILIPRGRRGVFAILGEEHNWPVLLIVQPLPDEISNLV